MQRFLAFLFMIIVAVAAFTPCCVLEDCEEDTTASQQEPQRADDGYGCSPFFSCTTCPGFAITEKPIVLYVPVTYQPLYFVADTGSIPAAYPSTPWQPPRVV